MRQRRIIYEDKDIIVETAPRLHEIPDLVYNYILEKKKPVSFREIQREFSGIVGEDRLRSAVSHLLALGKIIEHSDGRLSVPGIRVNHVEEKRRKGKRKAKRVIKEITQEPRVIYEPPEQR